MSTIFLNQSKKLVYFYKPFCSVLCWAFWGELQFIGTIYLIWYDGIIFLFDYFLWGSKAIWQSEGQFCLCTPLLYTLVFGKRKKKEGKDQFIKGKHAINSLVPSIKKGTHMLSLDIKLHSQFMCKKLFIRSINLL